MKPIEFTPPWYPTPDAEEKVSLAADPVWIKSAPTGGGSSLAMPIEVAPAEIGVQKPEEQPRDRSAPPDSGPATILVADDEAPIRILLDFYLTTIGYRVLLASDGESAVQIAREHPEIRLAILDVVMAGLSGQKLAEE